VIIVTPYLVRPVSDQLATPVDGYRAPTDPQRVLEGQSYYGQSGPAAQGGTPVAAPAPGIGAGVAAAAPGFKL
jgi:pilus assembly protein CpaC